MSPGKPGTTDGEWNIELTPRQKSLNIEYSALDYRNPKNIQYAHMLEGVDQDWSIERGQRTASYTNLEPGEYLFRVRSTNSDGIWVDNQRNIRITVNPSFWETVLAKILLACSSHGTDSAGHLHNPYFLQAAPQGRGRKADNKSQA